MIKNFKEGKLNRIPLHEWIILMTPKERELKIAARLFGVCPYELRCMFAFGENHVKTKIMK